MDRKKEYKTYIERNSKGDTGLQERDIAFNHVDDDMDDKERRKQGYIKKKRRNRAIKRTFLGLLLALSIIAGWAIATFETQVNAVLNRMDRDPSTDLSTVELDDDLLTSDKDVINILLVGSDKRATWTESGRSDSTMIATLDLKHKRLKLTSLMRDMYVPIPGHGDDRFNASYAYGGVKLLYETIATNFGIKLDGYVIVDFTAFQAVIDTVGGVEIELTDKEYKYLTTAYHRGSVLNVKPGLNNLNGEQALAYTRIRQDAEGDFGRTRRQRDVLQSIFNEAKGMSLSELVKLTETMMPYLATDLTNEEILSYIKSVVMLGTTEIDQMRIPVDNSFSQARIRNMAVLIPDIAINTQELNDFIFNYDGKENTLETVAETSEDSNLNQ
ncbi:LytR family transcriptional attenuator [Mobilisporobacter senegalensis]|uniref:LytR family transcriptional attenuator n=1 Tax=Mobilisporobacter senegalensis TaxID=1329262 RepID=A0A3N1XLE5_9FIRM|nr:LCP family protein [Mobilisporobacter senegalensis]ROR27533.1 LytR family transcriptional attenuator [Mobilisporobacter senegalensis]